MNSITAQFKANLPAVPDSFKMPAWAQRIYDHLTTTERVLLAWLALLVTISGVWTVVGYVGRNTELIAEDGGTYTEAAVGQPRFINPVLAGTNDIDLDISRLVYSSLFKYDNSLSLQNDLTTEYEVSEDGKTYTIRIRNDVAWHDGTPLTADDVVFTIRSIQTPEYGSPLASDFAGVAATAPDDRTVVFTLEEPYAPFLSSLTVGIMPQHVWADIAPGNAALAEQTLRPVGSGPYQFSELKTRRKTGEVTEFVLARNEAYYGPHQFLDNIAFTFFPTHEDALKAFVSGEVDGFGFLPLQLRDRADRSNAEVHRLLLPQYFALFFNQENNALLADSGIRNALSLALDRQAIVDEALKGEGESLHIPIPQGVFAFNEELEKPSVNIEAAIQNLEEAGWHDEDNDGIREKDDVRLHIKITTTDWPEYVQTVEIVQQQWLKIGVETEIEHFGPGTIQQTIIGPRDFEVLLFGEILRAEPDPYPFWHSKQIEAPGLNFAKFANKDVDKLLEDARTTINQEERQEKYKEFQGIILDIKPALILYRPYYLFIASDTVRGINANHAALAAGRFNNIEEWHVNVKRVWNGK